MKKETFLLTLMGFAAFSVCMKAAPQPPVEVATIKGKVAAWVWRDTTTIKREWDPGFSAEQTIDAHYLIILRDVSGVSKELKQTISEYSRAGYYLDPIMGRRLTDGEILIRLPSPKRTDIKLAANLTLKDYKTFCDEHAAYIESGAIIVVPPSLYTK